MNPILLHGSLSTATLHDAEPNVFFPWLENSIGPRPPPYRCSRSHSYAPHSVRLLWTSDRSVPRGRDVTTHNSHNTQTDIHAPGGIRTHNLSSDMPQTQTLDRAVTGTGNRFPLQITNLRIKLSEGSWLQLSVPDIDSH